MALAYARFDQNVSILSVISKIFEEPSLRRKNYYMIFSLDLDPPILLIQSCLMHLTDFIHVQLCKGNLVGMVLLDVQKAFDIVAHSVFLMIL